MKIVLFLGSALFLSACGGSGTSGGPSFNTLSSSGNRLIDQYGTAAETDVANMPTSGSATYKGVAAYSSDYSDAASILEYAGTLSELELTADFANSSISGRSYNFKNLDATTTVEGQINVSGAITGNTFNATVSGNTEESYLNQSANVSYDGTASGEFVGTDAEAIRGTGSVTGDAGIYGTYPVWFVWGVERQ